MIVQVMGTLLSKELERVEIMTSGGVAYELLVPLNVYETLPKPGDSVTLHTYLVVKEDGWQLFGFSSGFDRRVFQRVLGAKGVGPALALGLLSTLTAERLVRAIREKDIATLQSVPRVGRKKAEQLILDLADKLDDVQTTPLGAARPEGAGVEDAVRALRDRDIPTLQSVPRVGRKKAEQLILDLADKLDDLQVTGGGGGPVPEGAGAEDASRALVSLGSSAPDAERAVRAALDAGNKGMGAAELIRSALGKIRS